MNFQNYNENGLGVVLFRRILFEKVLWDILGREYR